MPQESPAVGPEAFELGRYIAGVGIGIMLGVTLRNLELVRKLERDRPARAVAKPCADYPSCRVCGPTPDPAFT